MSFRAAACSVAALVAVVGASSAAAQPAPDTNIVVTGERDPPTEREITAQARNISIIGDPRDNPLPRFEDRICPGVLGLTDDAAAYIIQRIRFNAEQFTNTPGVILPLEETIKSFKAICDGEYDHLPEAAFYMVGGIDEAVAKAAKLAEDA